jgi:hypothetical protein
MSDQEIDSAARRRQKEAATLAILLLLLLAKSMGPESVNHQKAPSVEAPVATIEASPPPVSTPAPPPPPVVASAPAAEAPAVQTAPASDRPAKPSASRRAERPAAAQATAVPAPASPAMVVEAPRLVPASGTTAAPSAPAALTAGVSVGSAPAGKVDVPPGVPLLQNEFAHEPSPGFGETGLSPADLSVVVSHVTAGNGSGIRGGNIVTGSAFGAATGVASTQQFQGLNGATVQNISIFATSR